MMTPIPPNCTAITGPTFRHKLIIHTRCKASPSIGLETDHFQYFHYRIGSPFRTRFPTTSQPTTSTHRSLHLAFTLHTHTHPHPRRSLPTRSPSHRNGHRRSPCKFVGNLLTSQASPHLMSPLIHPHSTPFSRKLSKPFALLVDHLGHDPFCLGRVVSASASLPPSCLVSRSLIPYRFVPTFRISSFSLTQLPPMLLPYPPFTLP